MKDKKGKIVHALPFNKYFKKNPQPKELIALNTGLTLSQVYHMRQGRMPSLMAALAMEDYTKGEVTCRDLLPPEDQEKIEAMKRNYENKIA